MSHILPWMVLCVAHFGTHVFQQVFNVGNLYFGPPQQGHHLSHLGEGYTWNI
jgi:hypothetical protein